MLPLEPVVFPVMLPAVPVVLPAMALVSAPVAAVVPVALVSVVLVVLLLVVEESAVALVALPAPWLLLQADTARAAATATTVRPSVLDFMSRFPSFDPEHSDGPTARMSQPQRQVRREVPKT
jgi:hypothetical protein